MKTAPLLDLFLRLRGLRFSLGASEYMLALEALAAGFGVGSREELMLMCQTVWAKSRDEQAQVARALDAALPRVLSADELEEMRKQAAASLTSGAPDAVIADRMRSLTQRRPSRTRAELEARRGAREGYGGEYGDADGAGFDDAQGADEAADEGARLRLRVERARNDFELRPRPPISNRQLRHGWRFYRLMRRDGPRTELDVQATIEEIHRLGEMLAPVLVPRARNLARLLILVDEGGSMIPFRQGTRALLDSAQQGDLGDVSVLYFYNVPGSVLFRDRELSDALPIRYSLKPFKRGGVLVISDAGAARGFFDESRLRRTVKFARTLKRLPVSAAWLNPTPESRWKHTTAEAIIKQSAIPMFTLDPAGIVGVVEALRGRGR